MKNPACRYGKRDKENTSIKTGTDPIGKFIY